MGLSSYLREMIRHGRTPSAPRKCMKSSLVISLRIPSSHSMTICQSRRLLFGAIAALLPLALLITMSPGHSQPARNLAGDYAQQVKPLLAKYCLECHSSKSHKGDIDLERFA